MNPRPASGRGSGRAPPGSGLSEITVVEVECALVWTWSVVLPGAGRSRAVWRVRVCSSMTALALLSLRPPAPLAFPRRLGPLCFLSFDFRFRASGASAVAGAPPPRSGLHAPRRVSRPSAVSLPIGPCTRRVYRLSRYSEDRTSNSTTQSTEHSPHVTHEIERYSLKHEFI